MDLDIQENVPLRELCTLGVGGNARFYVEAQTASVVSAAVAWADGRGLPLLVLGGGSNVVIADEGHPGLVLHVALRGIEQREAGGAVEVVAAAGEEWEPLVARAVEHDLAGFECLSGIPGKVGATPIQNVGAYGQEIKDTCTRVEVMDRATGETSWLSSMECRFAYRQSRFKEEDKGRFIVLAVAYRLVPGGKPAVRYAELERHLNDAGLTRPTLLDVRSAILKLRRKKSMVLDPADPDSRSVGSFFMNPLIPDDAADALEERLRLDGLVSDDRPLPRYPAGPGRAKLSAAWLIERAGLSKGLVHGPVGLSRQHTLAIVNRGGATARDVVGLARHVRDTVRTRFGVTLVPEPVFVNHSMD